jgi:molybdate transport system permease protein
MTSDGDAIWLSLRVGLVATALSVPPAVAVAWVLERTRWRWRGVLHTVVLLPLVLPPVVTGYLLLRAFGPRRWLGAKLVELGIPVAFHWTGAVVAAAGVGFPLLVLSITLALQSVDRRLEVVSRSLGRGSFDTFFRITLPLAAPGILAGAVLSFARGLGEFGAKIVLAGRIPGETETIPLAIYAALDAPGGEARVARLVLLSVVLGFGAVLVARALDARYRRRLELDR